MVLAVDAAGDRHWPDFLRAVGNPPELAGEPRFVDIPGRRDSAPELLLSSIGSSDSGLGEWGPVFDANDVWFAPVQTIAEAVQDPVIRAAGAIVTIEAPDGPKE